MPRVKSFDKEEALGKALNLFWEKGYEATSLTDLTTHLGIGKGSFYDTFGSKRELFDQALVAYRSVGISTLQNLLAEHTDPIGGVREFLKLHTQMMYSQTHAKGCFIANSTAELADDPAVQEFLLEHNAIMKEQLVSHLNGGRFSHSSSVIADLILAHVTGISVLSKIVSDKSRFEDSNKAFMDWLEKAIA